MKNYNMILTEKQQKYLYYHLEKIDKYEYLAGKEILPSDKKAYSPLGKALEKQIKTIEDQGKKQIKAIENYGKQLVESNEPIKKDFNININYIPHEKH